MKGYVAVAELSREVDSITASDAVDAELAASGDAHAFERLYRNHVGRIHNLARRMVGPDDADEAAQDVFVRAWEKLHLFRGESAFGTWLHRLAINVMLGKRQTMGISRGGSASLVEDYLELSGDEILYVGDHIWVDVTVSKAFLRWRTAAVLRELESDIAATERFRERQQELDRMMTQKERLERKQARLRLQLQRRRKKYQRTGHSSGSFQGIDCKLAELRSQLTKLDARISPLAAAASELSNPNWGLLMRAGNDKSHLARQVERSADIYLSRVSNFLFITPFAYLRSPGGSLPHDPL